MCWILVGCLGWKKYVNYNHSQFQVYYIKLLVQNIIQCIVYVACLTLSGLLNGKGCGSLVTYTVRRESNDTECMARQQAML
jgi:hypothetical protein